MVDYAERTAVYHIYDSGDVLIYVGVADRLGRRWDQHARKQPWWDSMHHQAVTWYETRDEALQVERDAIRDEAPVYNIIWNGPRPERPARRPEPCQASRPVERAADPVIYLGSGHIHALNSDLTGSGDIRDLGLIESACARPKVKVYGEEAYPTIWQKAGALLQSLACSPGHSTGNKRTAWMATMTFLEVNGHPLDDDFDDDEAEDFVLAVAQGILRDVPSIASGLVKFCQ